MTELLVIVQHPDEASRTPGKSCRWIAGTMIGDQTYTAASRSGAPNELARVLVLAGAPDMPVRVETAELRGYMTYRSLHDMARWSYEESATVPLRRIPYARVEAARQRARGGWVDGEKQASTPPGVVSEGVGDQTPINRDTVAAAE